MVGALILKEILDAIPVSVLVAAVLVVVGLESAGVAVIAPAIDAVVAAGEWAWNWFINMLKAEVGL